jgi:hypothetical protein
MARSAALCFRDIIIGSIERSGDTEIIRQLHMAPSPDIIEILVTLVQKNMQLISVVSAKSTSGRVM